MKLCMESDKSNVNNFFKRQSMKIKWKEKSQNMNSDSLCDDFLYAQRHTYLFSYSLQIS